MIRSKASKIFGAVNIVILSLLALSCLLPFIHIIAISFSSNAVVSSGAVTFWPKQITLYAYKYLLSKDLFWRSFMNSVVRVILGAGLNLLMIVVLAYPLSKEKKDFRWRNIYVWFFFFTSLFNGGLIPNYMLLNQLKMLNTIWALVLPCAVHVFNMILMLNFYRQLPREMEEAAFIDGAGQWRTLLNIYIPCSLPSIATLALFSVVNHWNAWFDGLIYMNDASNYPLQSYLQTVIIGLDITSGNFDPNDFERIKELSSRTITAAQIIIATLPVLLIYPFLQKYFVTGIVLGSVKG